MENNNNIPVGYVYRIRNKINNKTYIGLRFLRKDKTWRQYLGSGKLIRQAVEKYGRENFVKSLLIHAFTEDELFLLEAQLIKAEKGSGAGEYNLFVGAGAGGNTFAKLKEKDLSKVRETISLGLKSSPKLSAAMAKRKEENDLKYLKLFKELEKDILDFYKIDGSIKRTGSHFNISAFRLRAFLLENGIELNNQNVSGRVMPLDIRAKISKSLSTKSAKQDLLAQTCERCNVVFYNARTRMFCSSKCSNNRGKTFQPSLEEVNQLYMVEKKSIKELEALWGCKQRVVYYLLKEYDLPTPSVRDKRLS